MATFCIFTEFCPRWKPLKEKVSKGRTTTWQKRTREAASSFLDEIYRVTTTLSPSVTQKFMRLGYQQGGFSNSKMWNIGYVLQWYQILLQNRSTSQSSQPWPVAALRAWTSGHCSPEAIPVNVKVISQARHNSPLTRTMRTPIPNLKKCHGVRGNGCTVGDIPVFPWTMSNATSGRSCCKRLFIRWKSAIPPLCMNWS